MINNAINMTNVSSIVKSIASFTGLALFGLACLQDWATRLVPNRVPVAIAIAGGLVRVIDGTSLAGLLAATAVLVIAGCCWKRGWLGGADVKLFTVGAWLVSPSAVVDFVLASCAAGGVLATLYLGLGHIIAPPSLARPATRLRRYLRAEQWRLARRGPLPYATAIATGACFVLLRG